VANQNAGFTTLADAERMGFGEFLEHMLEIYTERALCEMPHVDGRSLKGGAGGGARRWLR
jgi:hypothetical protein